MAHATELLVRVRLEMSLPPVVNVVALSTSFPYKVMVGPELLLVATARKVR
jgi:hypothetical protein